MEAIAALDVILQEDTVISVTPTRPGNTVPHADRVNGSTSPRNSDGGIRIGLVRSWSHRLDGCPPAPTGAEFPAWWRPDPPPVIRGVLTGGSGPYALIRGGRWDDELIEVVW